MAQQPTDIPTKGSNPSEARPTRVTAATRVPMSLPTQQLAVPAMEGYHLHWFRAVNVPRALRAGYSFVDDDEVELTSRNVATSMEVSGVSDMGSRVSVYGGTDDKGESESLFLMKIAEEWWLEDQQGLEARNELVAAALRGGQVGSENGADAGKRYMKHGQDLFIPKRKA